MDLSAEALAKVDDAAKYSKNSGDEIWDGCANFMIWGGAGVSCQYVKVTQSIKFVQAPKYRAADQKW